MIVSLNWLKEYVQLPDSVDELTDRLTLSGLNLEGVAAVDDDTAIDLEVTSNRPDCLGHLGVAREIAVLYQRPLKEPEVAPPVAAASAPAQVTVDCPELCPRYTARVVRNVKVGPSPPWLAARLRTLGIAVINNVVDVTNYVMMECGQPLHAFDLGLLEGEQIVVRASRAGEKFTAINHHEYELPAGTCVIADAKRAVALGGVMGGADSEVSENTTNLLIEAADFAPLAVRSASRRLNLHSPSSYRFERGVDPQCIDWASRRCSELIAELAGGEIVAGAADVGAPTAERPEIKLRFPQVQRVLGIDVPTKEVQRILTALGCHETHVCDHCVKVVPPSWRADLTREIDLVEEVARIHGYDQIPEDAGVKMTASARGRDDRVLERVRGALAGAGYHEAMTLSAVDASTANAWAPWSDAPPLRVSTPVLRGADCLRQTLTSSLLAARRHNEKVANRRIELYELAKVYLPTNEPLPREKRLLSITTGAGYLAVKGVVEAVIDALDIADGLMTKPCELPLLDGARSAWLELGGRPLGLLGELSADGLSRFELRSAAAIAEIDVDLLVELAQLVPTVLPLSPYPPVDRDLNIVVDEGVRWSEVAGAARRAGGELLETIEYQETYRDADRLGSNKKSLLFRIELRSATATLTNEQADAVRDEIVAAIGQAVGGELRA